MDILSKLFIRIFNQYEGEDAFGNKYYANPKKGKRFVVYNGMPEPSKISGAWYSWLHYVSDDKPRGDELKHDWQKYNTPNVSGTIHKYQYTETKPKDSKYQSWQP
jgi:NADH:ubiquinone oxidoreductase subunit